MKQFFITSILAITIATPSWATGIAPGTNPAACTQPVLGTTSGTSNLEAGWTPNTLNIDWYNGETKLTSNTCTYDSGITVPSSNPSKTGYTFAGWAVKATSCGEIECFDLTLNGTGRYSKGSGSSSCSGRIRLADGTYSNTSDCSDSAFNDLAQYEWETIFDYGTVKGTSRCTRYNAQPASYYPTSNPDSGGTVSWNVNFCWCNITDINGVAQSLPWVMGYNAGTNTCSKDCAFNCSHAMMTAPLARASMYGLRQSVTDCTGTDKNACYASYNTVERRECLWDNGACYNRTVSDCATITSEHRCTESFECTWLTNASVCYNPQVDSCDAITDEERCNASYTDIDNAMICQWDGESCYEYYDD